VERKHTFEALVSIRFEFMDEESLAKGRAEILVGARPPAIHGIRINASVPVKVISVRPGRVYRIK